MGALESCSVRTAPLFSGAGGPEAPEPIYRSRADVTPEEILPEFSVLPSLGKKNTAGPGGRPVVPDKDPLRTPSPPSFFAGDDDEGPEADREALAWLNWVLAKAWPHTNEAVRHLVRTQIEPQLNEALPGVKISEISLGDNPPKLGPVSVRHCCSRSSVELDVGLEWDLNAKVSLSIPSIGSVGVNRIVLSGMVTIVLRPLLNSLPILAGLQIYMKSLPTIDWHLTGAGAIAECAFVKTEIHKAVMKIITDQILLPHVFCCHWLFGREDELNLPDLQSPSPEGLLRICVAEARGLGGSEVAGRYTVDPYAVVGLGTQKPHTTPAKPRTLTPAWGDEGWADLLVHSFRQQLSLEIWDKQILNDCVIGAFDKVRIVDLAGRPDSWWPIFSREEPGTKTGEVRLLVESFGLSNDSTWLEDCPQPRGGATTQALLQVQIRCLCGLSRECADGSIVTLTVEGNKHDTPKSVYAEMPQDLVYNKSKVIEPSTQRLADIMVRRQQVPVDEVARIAGVDRASLVQALKQKPAFTARWDHQVTLPLRDPRTATVTFRLAVPGKHHDGLTAALESNLEAVAKTITADDVTFEVRSLITAEGMSWEGQLQMPGTGCSHSTGTLELDVKISLLSLRPGSGHDMDGHGKGQQAISVEASAVPDARDSPKGKASGGNRGCCRWCCGKRRQRG